MPKKDEVQDAAPGSAGHDTVQITGDPVLIRLAWRWLERWQEPLLVGTAVAISGLSSLLPVVDDPSATHSRQDPSSQLLAASAQRSTLPLPRDAQYYRDQWARDAKQFYSLHPPRPSGQSHAAAKAAPVAAAAFTTARQTPAPVRHAYTAEAPQRSAAVSAGPAVAQPLGQNKLVAAAEPSTIPTLSQRLRRWRVAGCLVAGIFASLVFAIVWPAVADERRLGKPAEADPTTAAANTVLAPLATEPSPVETIAIGLPAAWVRVRPTIGQTVRRGVLTASYLLAALGGWSLIG